MQLKMEFLLEKLLKQQASHLETWHSTLGDTAHLEIWHMLRTDLKESMRVELTCSDLLPHRDIFRDTDTKLSSMCISVCQLVTGAHSTALQPFH